MRRYRLNVMVSLWELSGRAVKVFAVDWEAAAAVNQLEEVVVLMNPVLRWKWNIAAQLSGRYYSIMVDETTDVSNNEQLVFCVRLLCPTRWTVKAEAFTSISENYEALMETWAEAKQINNDSEMRARIGGVAKQMESFDFFFGLELGRIVFSMSDNLSIALQGSSISASEGQSLMKMTLVAFQAIRSEDSFSVFWKTIERKRQLCKAVLIADPSLPRQRKVPKDLEIGSSAPEFANIVEDVYRKAYYEIIDFVVQSIKDRFDQNGYKVIETGRAAV
eukprot:Em0001g937a